MEVVSPDEPLSFEVEDGFPLLLFLVVEPESALSELSVEDCSVLVVVLAVLVVVLDVLAFASVFFLQPAKATIATIMSAKNLMLFIADCSP